MTQIPHNVDVVEIDNSIQLLHRYIKETSIEPVISILEALKQDPDNGSLLTQLSDTLDSLGTVQGAVLTYAPYISILLSHDLFENED